MVQYIDLGICTETIVVKMSKFMETFTQTSNFDEYSGAIPSFTNCAIFVP